MVVATANSGETPFMYHHTSLTFALFGAFAGVRLLRATSAGGDLLLGMLAGAMIGVSFQVKQTVGGMNLLVLTAAVALISLRRSGLRTALLRVAAIGAGFALSCVPAALWLWSHDLWPAFIDNAFMTGPKAKGDLWRISSGRSWGAIRLPTTTCRPSSPSSSWPSPSNRFGGRWKDSGGHWRA